MALKRVNFATAHNASTFTSARWNFQPVPDGFGNAPIQLVEIAPGNPRFAYDPATGEPKGLLIEEQRTNLVPNNVVKSWPLSTEFTSEVVGDYNGLEVLRIESLVTGGVIGSGSNSAAVLDGVPLADVFYTFTVHVKKGNSPCVALLQWVGETGFCRYNFDEDEFEHISEGYTASSKAIGGGWVEISLVGITTALDRKFRLSPCDSSASSYNKTEGQFVDVAFAQVEQGAFATSLIVTNGTTVTRTADIVARTLGSEFNPSEGVFVVEVGELPPTSSTPITVISLEDPSNQNHFVMYVKMSGNLRARTRVDGVTGVEALIGAVASGDVITVQYSSAGVSVRINDGSYVFIGQLEADTISVMKVGNYAGGTTTPATLNGSIKSVTYEPRSTL